MASSSSSLTLEDIRAFQEKNQTLYSFLTVTLWRNPFMSVNVMAMWLWLSVGFKNLDNLIMVQSKSLVNEIADEVTT